MKLFAHTIIRLLVISSLLIICFPAQATTKRALLVGISNYGQSGANSWNDIHGANDVELISKTLKKQDFKIITITNKNATARRIRKELKSLSNSCRKGDVVYIHFSCHGQPYEDLDGDEEDGWDESLVPYDARKVFSAGKYEGVNHIKDDELHTYIQKIRKAVGSKGFVCVIIDACHAGGSSRGDEGDDEDDDDPIIRGTKDGFSPHGKSFRPRIDTKSNFKIASSAGLSDVVIVEACRSYQSNCEIKQNGKYYGPLSYYLNKTLQSYSVSANLNWVNEVKSQMDRDRRLTKQNLVYETSLK